MVSEEKIKEEIVSTKDNSIIIKFETLFKRDLSKYNEFPIVKRSYHKKLYIIADEIKNIIEDKKCLDYAYNVLYFKFNLIKTNEITLEQTRNYIKEKFFNDEKLISTIHEMVDSAYELSLDSTGTVKNENLQITDDMNKKYLKSAIMIRLLVPIVSILSERAVSDQEELDKYIFEIFTDCMLFFNDGNDEILSKLYNIVSSRIISSRYSDKDIWNFLEKLNKDISLTVRNFYNYVIVNNFPKILNGTSIISYIDVILRNKLNFVFTLPYKVNHKTLDHYAVNENKSSSDNNLSEIDKLEATLLRKDKGIAFLNDLSIKQKINSIKNEIEDEEDFDIFRKVAKVNEFTKMFLRIYYKKDFDIVFTEEYTPYLLYNMLNNLDRNTFKLLREIVVSDEVATRINNKRKIIDKLSESVKYNLLLEKYSDIRDLINSDKNFINDMIVKLKSRQFINPFTEEEIVLDIDKLNEEVLDFLFL